MYHLFKAIFHLFFLPLFICFLILFFLHCRFIGSYKLQKYSGRSYILFIQFPSAVLFLNHEHRNRKRDLIFLNTYQNENKSHAIFLHLLNHEAKILKAGAEGEVQLPVHVIDVYMLDILKKGTSKMLGILQQGLLRAHGLLGQAPVLLLADPSPGLPESLISVLPRLTFQFC